MSNRATSQRLIFQPLFLLQVAAVCVFAGRAWQHLRFDAPYRTLLWDERWMKNIVAAFGMDWSDYVTSPGVDAAIDAFTRGMGWFYLLCALCAAAIHRLGRPASWIVTAGGVMLVFLAFLYTKEKFFFAGEFFEFALQCGTPFFLVWLNRYGTPTPGFIRWLKITIALTFICHGLYAIGFYPRPGNFIEMTMNILHVDEQQAVVFLNFVGVLDFLLSICIFLPWRWPILIALAYAAFWGMATSIARTWAYFNPEFLDNTLAQWLHETVLRLPHGLGPLVALICIAKLSIHRHPESLIH
jgi:hypothetical protein